MKYDESIKVYRDYLVTIEGAVEEGLAKGMAQGMAQGMAKGMAKGFEKGMAQGMEKGMAQGMEKGKMEGYWEVARNMKSLDIAPDVIMKATGLTAKEIEKI